MTPSIAHLGPPGTNAETAAIVYRNRLQKNTGHAAILCPYPTIAQTLKAVAAQQVDLAVVPVENSIQGSVAVTLDTLWELEHLQIQQALILPIHHVLVSCAADFQAIQTVYSHPQALAQCQRWLECHLPQVQQLASNSTTEALAGLRADPTVGAIASARAAHLYDLPILADRINDYPDNCTRFWVVGREPGEPGDYISLAFSAAANLPGALAKPLQVFADRHINLSRIESRPTKRSLGEYLFFIDLNNTPRNTESLHTALHELPQYTEILKIFGCYAASPILAPELEID
ncbi:prephenate dehydratase [Spirulina major CS-329]|uniref:prephenate dehydratase n=1 Tax=Spirulina TaxID=1154 RepID=UPI002330196C|nr:MULTISPECIES: prephenate dehydratase [Spirulina]MDB9493292.1 prephenate dehydratase [Spirulina subsalsa CS-330]MDB9502041.1 prephenate dehydratase [Spirulina major CS-329]